MEDVGMSSLTDLQLELERYCYWKQKELDLLRCIGEEKEPFHFSQLKKERIDLKNDKSKYHLFLELVHDMIHFIGMHYDRDNEKLDFDFDLEKRMFTIYYQRMTEKGKLVRQPILILQGQQEQKDLHLQLSCFTAEYEELIQSTQERIQAEKEAFYARDYSQDRICSHKTGKSHRYGNARSSMRGYDRNQIMYLEMLEEEVTSIGKEGATFIQDFYLKIKAYFGIEEAYIRVPHHVYLREEKHEYDICPVFKDELSEWQPLF